MIFQSAGLLPPKQAVRTAGVVTTPVALTTGAVHAPAIFGSRKTPSSAVPDNAVKPAQPQRKIAVQLRQASEASCTTVAACRWMVFHSCPKKK